jgi:hypothetical protein
MKTQADRPTKSSKPVGWGARGSVNRVRVWLIVVWFAASGQACTFLFEESQFDGSSSPAAIDGATIDGMTFDADPLAPDADPVNGIVLQDGHTGPYRIAFVTNGTRNAESPTIADYNSFVTTEAGLAGATAVNDIVTTWTAIGSTAAVSARANTGTYTLALDGAGLYDAASDVPIYTTNGLRMADNNADLWDASIATPVYFGDGTQAGDGTDTPAREPTWTGSQPNGDSRPPVIDGTALGDSSLEVGGNYDYVQLVRGGYTTGAWIGGAAGAASDWSFELNHLMGMSAVIVQPSSASIK